jgi:flavin reductase (DIM6/NTAB) family NADH-FMN oxidoreductase RutF
LEYRRIAPIMGQLWSPIAAVTSGGPGRVNVQIAVAIGAASIVPHKPRVLVQVYKGNFSHRLIMRSRAFALNFLRQDQLHLIRDFGFESGRDRDKLAGVAYRLGATGSPLLEDCWGYLECRVVNAMDGGDMTCILADVVEGETRGEGPPLWWREARRRLPPEWLEEWDRKIGAEIQRSTGRMELIDYTPWDSIPRDGAPGEPAEQVDNE